MAGKIDENRARLASNVSGFSSTPVDLQKLDSQFAFAQRAR